MWISFPLDIVFRIYDNCLASGIEAMFAFGIVLLQKNEEALLARKFDDILSFLTNELLDHYQVSSSLVLFVRPEDASNVRLNEVQGK